ncbi:hypothetical protein [Leuconostoc falkenbergense]|uniref:hypothetical protein n=1 Tax=Leuconostoc falkenbergense TaxID=2766470 RepID=UPI0021AAFECA|nr:hypothetical protein [Leuconostoc falkenbergense]
MKRQPKGQHQIKVRQRLTKLTKQKVEVHYYNIKKTPKVEKTATPETPKAVETASILSTTHASENQGGVFLSAMAGLASLGLAFGISKKGKKQN